jgi:hypothetical protein
MEVEDPSNLQKGQITATLLQPKNLLGDARLALKDKEQRSRKPTMIYQAHVLHVNQKQRENTMKLMAKSIAYARSQGRYQES